MNKKAYETFHELLPTGVEVGQRRPKFEGLAAATGKLTFVDDLELPGMLYAKGVYSKKPHARIRVDTSKAEKIPGVKAVITGKDFPWNRYWSFVIDQPILAEAKVRYVGEWIALVAAEKREIAEEAAQQIVVEYDELPAVFDPRDAMKPGAPQLHDQFPNNIVPYTETIDKCQIRWGDIEEGFKKADYIFTNTFTTPVMEHALIEPHVAMADYDSCTDKLTIWTMSQMPFFHSMIAAQALKIPLNKLRMVTPACGAGHGGKNDPSIEPHVGLLAMLTRRPVKWAWNTEEELITWSTRHAYVVKHTTGVTKEGKIVAKKIEAITDNGAYTIWGLMQLHKHSILGHGPYNIPNVYVDGYCVYTNKQPGGALRGFGVAQATWAFEQQMDIMARELGIDPMEFRLQNTYKTGDYLTTGCRLRSVGIDLCAKKVMEMANYKPLVYEGRVRA